MERPRSSVIRPRTTLKRPKKDTGLPINIQKKAELMIQGEVHVASGTVLPCFPIRSSGGPTSSRPHIVLCFGPNKTRVKVALGPISSRFELKVSATDSDEFIVLDKGRPFLEKVHILPAVMHAPEQAFVNIDAKCGQGCLFCSAGSERELGWPAKRWVKLIVDRFEHEPFSAVAVTAGMPHGIRAMVEMMVEVVAGVREALPKLPIGVEPNALSLEALEMLHAAGADELKVNVQTATNRIFKKVCPKLDRKDIMRCLRDGVEVFGPGNVCSNVIIGFGETEKEVLDCVRELAAMGVVANIRAIRVNDVNRARLEDALGTKVGITDPKRIARLVKAQKAIFQKCGLRPGSFRTMCHKCACCDLTVGVDL